MKQIRKLIKQIRSDIRLRGSMTDDELRVYQHLGSVIIKQHESNLKFMIEGYKASQNDSDSDYFLREIKKIRGGIE